MSSIGELPGFEAKWWDMLWETAQALVKRVGDHAPYLA
jgi:hypothetical protein